MARKLKLILGMKINYAVRSVGRYVCFAGPYKCAMWLRVAESSPGLGLQNVEAEVRRIHRLESLTLLETQHVSFSYT